VPLGPILWLLAPLLSLLPFTRSARRRRA
jgi:hypothetical protein